MQAISSSSCHPTSQGTSEAAATQGAGGFRGSAQDRADQLVRATVLSDLGGSSHGGHRSSIQSIAGTIMKVLSTSDATGTDASDEVLNKLEQSLHKAAQKLADRGVDAKTIDATIDKFRSQLAGALDKLGASPDSTSAGTSGDSTTTPSTTPPATTPAATDVTSVNRFVASEVRKERGTIDLVTAEGDKVSIRFRTTDVVKGSVTETTMADGSKTIATSASELARGGVKISVDGDLNDKELAAIGNLLGKVDEIATKFFSGDVQAAFNAAGSLDVSSDQIASYSLDVTYSKKVAAAAWGAARISDASSSGVQSPTQPAADGTDPAASAASTSTGAATTQPVTPSSGGTADAGSSSAADSNASATGSTGSTDNATGATSTSTPPASSAPASAQKTIVDFINDALSKLGSASGAGRLTFSAHFKVRVLVTALQTLQPAKPATPADESAAKNTQLLGDSLQKVASA